MSYLIRKNSAKIFILNQRNFGTIRKYSQHNDNPENYITNKPINCDKSNLLKQHQNILHNKIPYTAPHSWIHLTEKYQRKIFGRYGSESGVDARVCFNKKSEKSQNTYDLLREPETIASMINKHKFEQKCKIDELLKREEDINKKLEKLDQWKEELNSRILKKEATAIAAKEKKERLVEEVRRHFGYKVDPKDERFKEVLEQKEREDKKKLKEEKRKAKEQKLMSRLVANTTNT